MNFISAIPPYVLSSPPLKKAGDGVIASTLMGEFGVSMEVGYLHPPCAKPMVDNRKKHPFTIEYVEKEQEDPMYFHFSACPSETTFLTLEPVDLHDVDVATDRHCLRHLFTAVSPVLPDAFLCKKKPFTILTEKVGGKVLLQKYNSQQGGAATWDTVPGGYGEGFEKALTVPNSEIEDMFYYRIVSYTLGSLKLVVRHEVDCVDAKNASVELKSAKGKLHRRTGDFMYELNQDFYLNLWIQMAISDTRTVKIGRHCDGAVKQLLTLSLTEVAKRAGVTPEYSAAYLRRMTNVLLWIQKHLPEGAQGLVQYTEGAAELTLKIVNEDNRLPCISDDVRSKILSLNENGKEKGSEDA